MRHAAALAGAPARFHDIHPAALRRWFAHADTLPEGVAYRPRTLAKLARDIDALRDRYVPIETKGIAAARYVVKPNDILSRIARDELGDVERYREIFELNRDLLDSPDHIFPDDALRMPADWTPSNPGSDAASGSPAPP